MVIKPLNHLPYEHAIVARARFDAENEQIVREALPVTAVFIGDSLTEGWNLDAAFADVAGRIINRGIGGDTTWGVAGRFAADALQLKPQLVVLLIGINDTWALDDPAADERTLLAIEETIADGIANIVTQTRAQNQRLALCSLLPVNIPAHTPGSPTNEQRNALVLRVNTHVQQIAVAHDCRFVNYHTTLAHADGRTLRADVSSDGIHLNSAGYLVLTNTIRSLLNMINPHSMTTVSLSLPT